MNKQNHDKIEKEAEKKQAKKDKKKRRRMKVSGAQVKGLQRIIGKK